MTQRELIVIGAAAVVLLMAVSAMAAMHEKHYRNRSEAISRARASGHIEDRLSCLEAILSEDRLT